MTNEPLNFSNENSLLSIVENWLGYPQDFIRNILIDNFESKRKYSSIFLAQNKIDNYQKSFLSPIMKFCYKACILIISPVQRWSHHWLIKYSFRMLVLTELLS